MNDNFKQDCVEILKEKYESKQISRRTVLSGLVALGVAAVFRPSLVNAADDELVVVNWGGDAMPAYRKAFTDNYGTKVKLDGSGALEGSMKTQFESKSVRWDVCDAEPYSALNLGRQGMIEPIDYTIVDKSKIEPGFAGEFSAPAYFYSYVMAYNAKKFGDKAPTSWADFWDVEKFPGKRTMYKWMTGVLETALMADGVAPTDLYPLDVDRALAKVAALRPHIVSFWGSGAESQQLLRDGEASMGMLWHTRANLTQKDTDGDIKWTYDQGIVTPAGWTVIKGNPAGKKRAMEFIAHCQKPENQITLLRELGNGLANPAGHALVPDELKGADVSSKENMARQVAIKAEWYVDHYGKALDKYLAIVGK